MLPAKRVWGCSLGQPRHSAQQQAAVRALPQAQVPAAVERDGTTTEVRVKRGSGPSLESRGRLGRPPAEAQHLQQGRVRAWASLRE